ncbi:hypothetical protein [Alkalihalobacterium bogoriense]|uniref:hypothetical protein n=1 Tax=Alkalihalobacterium bogoriense TaxID=246272 RepID=UPI00047A7E37|nr:hypothetical protein [Alkalihalobacterium bogoriense]
MKKLLLGILSIMIILTGMYFFSTAGDSATFENKSIPEINEQIVEKYLSEEVMNPNFGGEIFVAYEILESDKNKGEIYLWALIEEYYKKDEDIETGSGMSVPIVLSVRGHNNDSLEILSHSIPREGSYPEDIKEMFPKKIQNKILNYSSNHIGDLIEEIENRVKENY